MNKIPGKLAYLSFLLQHHEAKGYLPKFENFSQECQSAFAEVERLHDQMVAASVHAQILFDKETVN